MFPHLIDSFCEIKLHKYDAIKLWTWLRVAGSPAYLFSWIQLEPVIFVKVQRVNFCLVICWLHDSLLANVWVRPRTLCVVLGKSWLGIFTLYILFDLFKVFLQVLDIIRHSQTFSRHKNIYQFILLVFEHGCALTFRI